eukprot:CAMPEP_0177576808 /NCGR_PEP_ID=MMETSP0369-20130122/80316_1 /TAXON_ID=447022 ORGANISM="Scrippsiella hangoei-like, Strain SHHI-4" /NCGR_SAMPLE_ID=MMETSP0369 /ASSEMBLY_ACC=CAM_ASM_000364 /LENGTH=118 /DNA_ID=CAMNT_0019065127 /DNA_START=117 /DNA_END=472 /DNA_ORIENTATION=-
MTPARHMLLPPIGASALQPYVLHALARHEQCPASGCLAWLPTRVLAPPALSASYGCGTGRMDHELITECFQLRIGVDVDLLSESTGPLVLLSLHVLEASDVPMQRCLNLKHDLRQATE